MVAPSKKLTVSFGAFACTLEGFDDPFPVMRQVVDYFQALASADPSFGAHPERPDTDYLKTLAQESAGGTIEAELSEGGMILRQSSGPELETTLEAVEDEALSVKTAAPTAQVIAFKPDELMQEALSDERFEDVDTLLEQSAREPQFEDVVEDYNTDLHETDQGRSDLISEEDMSGAGLPDWAQDLIEDAMEHGEAAPEIAVDPVLEEDAALERVLKAEAERTQVVPELDRSNPLAQLRAQEDAQIEEIEPEQEDSFEQMLAEEIAKDEPEAQPLPIAEDVAEDVDDIFRAFAGEAEVQAEAPVSAAEILRQEVEREAELEKAEAAPEPTPRVLTAAATAKVSGSSMRLSFDGDAPLPLPAPVAKVETPVDMDGFDTPEPLIMPEALELSQDDSLEPLVLTEEQVVPHFEVPTLVLVPEDQVAPELDNSLSDDLNTFAASVGAATLPELLEASAAYVTLVSGRSKFSRRDIMTLLDEMSQEQKYSQEARIKSFGKLLRGGSILRTEDGQFAISDRALNSYEVKAGVA